MASLGTETLSELGELFFFFTFALACLSVVTKVLKIVSDL